MHAADDDVSRQGRSRWRGTGERREERCGEAVSAIDFDKPFKFTIPAIGCDVVTGAIRMLQNRKLGETVTRFVIEPEGVTIEAVESEMLSREEYINASIVAFRGRLVNAETLLPGSTVRYSGMISKSVETIPAKGRVEAMVVADYFENGLGPPRSVYLPAELTEYVAGPP